jgi:transposase
MQEYIMVGCDLHDRSMLLKIARGREEAQKRSFSNDAGGRAAMMGYLQAEAEAVGEAKVLFAYEAAGQGFGLYDELREAGFECHVLAPTKMPRSPKQRKSKTDERDAQRILELIRGHVLAGNVLPGVWVPDPQTRDDRELVRARLDANSKLTRAKAQVQSLLKRNGVSRPAVLGQGWTSRFQTWLGGLSKKNSRSTLGPGARSALRTLLNQMEAIEDEMTELDQAVKELSRSKRYAAGVEALQQLKGVGLLTAMVFLTEMGDLKRFSNRRQVAAYLGLVPSSQESGEADDRKGHITRQGSGRVRYVLCQATWSAVRSNPAIRDLYERLRAKNPKKKKISLVGAMRRLAVIMWHRGLEAQATTQKKTGRRRRRKAAA